MKPNKNFRELAEEAEAERIVNKIDSEVTRNFGFIDQRNIILLSTLATQAPSSDYFITIGAHGALLVLWSIPAFLFAKIVFMFVFLAFFLLIVGLLKIGLCLQLYSFFIKVKNELKKIIDSDPDYWISLLKQFKKIVLDAGGTWDDRLIPLDKK